ncbi:Multidrug export protein MepA [bioreactor metagenome]|uniref:Multidrug export protein MepA n=1 Tax=bioreactor metagenome TaxID=1076179 RepID=A0A644ZF76_9ZZZZ
MLKMTERPVQRESVGPNTQHAAYSEKEAASMETDNRTLLFEKLPVHRAVCRQIIPAIASQMIALIYNLADTYFVGMLDDPAQTAAVTVVYASFVMLTAVSNLFGVGGGSMVARALGKKELREAKQISSISFWGGLFCAGLFSGLFLLFEHPLLVLCGAREGVYPFAVQYAKWVVVIGGPFTILNTLLANLVRAEGSAVGAFAGVSIGGLLNIALDPLFVLPQFLGMGSKGAGIATAISNMAAVLYFIIYLARRRGATVICIDPRALSHTKEHLRGILAVGFPSAMQYALTVVAIAAQSRFVSKYATEAIAALGIVKKLDQLPLYFSIGVSNGLLPLLAYSHSSGNQTRRRQAFRFGCSISLGFSLLCFVGYEIFAPQLSALFIDNALTVRYSTAFLRIMVTAMPMMSVCYPCIIQFQAMGRTREALIASVLRKGVLDIPLLFLMDALFPLYGCMWVQPIVDTVSLGVATGLYLNIQKHDRIEAAVPLHI